MAALLVLAAIIATIGRPLVGIGSLHAADTLQTLDPWAQTAPEGFRPDNGTVSDTVDAIAPVRLSIAARARAGDLAMWSSSQGGGAPLLGVPNTAMFSPLSLPWWLAPAHAAPALAKALQMLVAAAGLFLFARRIGASRIGAIVGALAFVNAGHLVVWTTWPQSNVAALTPWLLWSVQRALAEGGESDWWPVPLVGAAMWLEGFPSLTLWAHVLAGSWIFVQLWSRRRPGRMPLVVQAAAGASLDGAPDRPIVPLGDFGDRSRLGLRGASALVLGVAIAGVQLVPFALRIGELSLGGARAAKASDVLPWEALGTVLFPRMFGASGQGVWYGPTNEVELQSFLGMVAFVLVAAAWVWGRELPVVRGWWRWSSLALATVAAMIWVSPVNALVQELPVVGGNQTGRLRGLLAVLFAVLVALGFDTLQAKARSGPAVQPPRRRNGATVARIVFVGLLVSLAAAWRARPEAIDVGRDDFLRSAITAPLVVLGVAAILVAVVLRGGPRWRHVALGLLPVLLAIEVVTFARGFLPRIDTKDFYPRTEAHDVVAALVGSDRFAAGGLALYPGTTTLYGLRSLTAHAAMPAGWRDLLEAADPSSLVANNTFPIFAPRQSVAASRELDLLGVSHFVTAMAVPVFGDRDPDQPASRPLPDGAPINGIEIDRAILGMLADHDPPVGIGVHLLSPDGATIVASGERRLDPGQLNSWLAIPLHAADGMPPPTGGRFEVFLRLDPLRGGLTIPVDPALPVRAVRVSEDGLAVVATPGVVVYERPNARPRIRMEASDGNLARDASVQVTLDLDDELTAEVTAATPRRLVVADARSGGHRATVDGVAVPVGTAHGALVAITVPAGTHEVHVWFEPEGFRIGATLSVLAMLATWAMALRTISTRRLRRGG